MLIKPMTGIRNKKLFQISINIYLGPGLENDLCQVTELQGDQFTIKCYDKMHRNGTLWAVNRLLKSNKNYLFKFSQNSNFAQ